MTNNYNKTQNVSNREPKKGLTFNLSEFLANKTSFSCWYSGISFYYPERSTR